MQNLRLLLLLSLPLAAPAQTLLVVNQGDATVNLIDPKTTHKLATIAENTPTVHVHEAATSLDGRTAYLPVYGSAGVGKPGIDGHEMLVLDIPSHTITGHVDFGHAVRPHLPVLDPASGLLYVTTELDKSVTIIDPKSLKIIGAIPTGQEQSHMLVLSHDGHFGYTANVGPGTVSVLDMRAKKTLAIIPISTDTQRISISNDDKLVFTADQTKPQLAVIDTATNKVRTRIPLPDLGYGAAPTPDGRYLLIALPSKNAVAVVDLKSMQVTRTLPVGAAPQEILIRPDGKVAYVSCVASANVAAITLSDWTTTLIPAGPKADGLAWAK
jgi:YVTN family beta-propeller protein